MKKWMMALVAMSTMTAVTTPILAQTMPANTSVYVTLDESVSSRTAKVGQILTGSVSQNVVVNGKTAIPKGSNANLVVASVQASGRLSTPAKLYVRLDSVVVNGKTISARSNLWGQTEKSKAKRDAVGIGGGAAAGAIIGAIAGGGKGAEKRRKPPPPLAPAPGPLEPLPLERRTSNSPPKQRSSLRQNPT